MLLSTTIPITGPRMVHDFMMTKNHIIIPDSPMELRPDICINEGKFIFQFDGEKSSRYGIMKRRCQNPDQVQWFEVPGHMVFHYVNAWEEKAANGDDIIRCFGCVQKRIDIDFTDEHPFLKGKFSPVLTKFIFNLTTGKVEMTKLFEDMACEFPVID